MTYVWSTLPEVRVEWKMGVCRQFYRRRRSHFTPPTRPFFFFCDICHTKTKTTLFGAKTKKPKKSGKKGVVLLAQTSYLPFAFQLVQRRLEGSTVSFFSVPPAQVVQKIHVAITIRNVKDISILHLQNEGWAKNNPQTQVTKI